MDTRDEGMMKPSGVQHRLTISEMFENWFIDYASYVILERAVPDVSDGLKPVQRRILHSMWELEDGRYNKVANIIGNTMKYHPHGDASIYEALIQLGQKDLFIDCQGNWGNIYTGDMAAAARYIEARLSAFAKEVVFSPEITEWRPSYDGRNQEPVLLPIKFPALLFMGVEGIAVGLASKILPHNFIELLDASIAILNGEDFELYPDFPTGGLADVSKYNEGKRGGRVRVRARISKLDTKTLVITEIPYGMTTTALIESIMQASEKGKVKIRKIDDNTAEQVEIILHLSPGADPDQTIDALYAFTACELTLSPNCCVIHNGKPAFLDVKTVLRINTERTVDLLRQELNVELHKLTEEHFFLSLERIFVVEKIYRRIEDCQTWEEVLETIRKGLEPHKNKFYREITQDDLVKLTEIKIKRISRYDLNHVDEKIKQIEQRIAEVKHHLSNIIEYAKAYFERLKQKYGKGRERRTELRSFEQIEAVAVAASNVRLYVDRAEGFIGWGLKKHEFVEECSDLDEIIVFREDGAYQVVKIAEKVYVGKNIIHAAVYRRNDTRTTYNVIYQDLKTGISYVKRFTVLSVLRDREYNVCGVEKGRILYFSANPNQEAEVVTVLLKPRPRLKKLQFDFDFSDVLIKGRSARGNILTRYAIRKILKKQEGKPVIQTTRVWFDTETLRLNTEERGIYVGEFLDNDKIVAFYPDGSFVVYQFQLHLHFDDKPVLLKRFHPTDVYNVIYYHQQNKAYYLKRFQLDGVAFQKKMDCVDASEGNTLYGVWCCPDGLCTIVVRKKRKQKASESFRFSEFISIKGVGAKGKKLTDSELVQVEVACDKNTEKSSEDVAESDQTTLQLAEQQDEETLTSLSQGNLFEKIE